ncbi:hypothetical protein MHYP_G00256640 [Metynnis hypsauchen]
MFCRNQSARATIARGSALEMEIRRGKFRQSIFMDTPQHFPFAIGTCRHHGAGGSKEFKNFPFGLPEPPGPWRTMENHSVLGPKQECVPQDLTMSLWQNVLHVKTRAEANHLHAEAIEAVLFSEASLVCKALLFQEAAD